MRRKALIISPTGREYKWLPDIADALGCELVFDDFAGSFFDDVVGGGGAESAPRVVPLIEETARRYESAGLAGVTSGVAYPGMTAAAVVARRLGLRGPDARSVLLCEHKYYSRLAQRRLVPEATPRFGLVDPRSPRAPEGLSFPVFVKPVKSSFSMNARLVSSQEELRELVAPGPMPEAYLKPFDDLLRRYTDFEAGGWNFIAESPLEGAQVSLEGYAFGGRVHTLGIIDSIMYPGTISFRRFQYPSRLPAEVQRRMSRVAQKFIEGIGYDDALFNVEFIYDAARDALHVVEFNPKIASQFTDLFEKVDGSSSYRTLLQAALGDEPDFEKGAGPFRLAASCVLRRFEDGRVLRVPSGEDIDALKSKLPDARVEVTAEEGRRLSDVMQDGKSFRYCVVNLGADSEKELEEKLELCEAALDFRFAPP
ncbi:MAG TPA: ATP-grasp domain-containing protein [Pyrinomonadaceae bacterium]|nr:ATP-grasp domain-containing protein [Pyrinomonadaceae bacterium]